MPLYCALCPERDISNHTGIKIYNHLWLPYQGFPGSSAGKKSTCNAGGPGSIPGLERSSGEGVGYPLWYSWVSLVAQKAKNPPVMRDTWVHPWVRKIPLEEGMATHSSILAWRIPWTEEPGGPHTVHGAARSRT